MPNRYNFSEGLRRALELARSEAQKRGSSYVGTEHLALGILATAEGSFGRIMAIRDRERLLSELEQFTPQRQGSPSAGELPYTSGAKRALEKAMEAARTARATQVRHEHLLLGVLSVERDLGAQALTEGGVSLETVREALFPGSVTSPVSTAGYARSLLRRLLRRNGPS